MVNNFTETAYAEWPCGGATDYAGSTGFQAIYTKENHMRPRKYSMAAEGCATLPTSRYATKA